jgi:NAD(P)-dependent dehydrogenase (short-subunit alcohol dehydrogenase family)
MSVEGKVVIITGGASGIGRASAFLLARHGARVVIADRNARDGAAVRAAIEADGGGALDVAMDVASSREVDAMVERARQAFGRVDVLLHCAGICPRQPVLELSDEDWRHVLSVNLDGTFYVTRAVGRVMAAQRSGTMILLTSDRGLYGSADYAHYAASKGAMIALTKSLAIALGRDGVTVNGLNPGMTDTPLARGAITPESWRAKESYDVMGTHSIPEDIAEIVLFLAGTAGRFMTGQIVATRMRSIA